MAPVGHKRETCRCYAILHIWGIHVNVLPQQSIILLLHLLLLYVIHQYFEACYLKSPGNMGMPLRTIIPTFLILKSFSVIPHQEWDQIQVLLREEREEGEGHEEGQKRHKMIQTQIHLFS